MSDVGLGGVSDDVLLLVRMGIEGGYRVDPERIGRRPPDSASRQAFYEAQKAGLLDSQGWVTPMGEEAVKAWAK